MKTGERTGRGAGTGRGREGDPPAVPVPASCRASGWRGNRPRLLVAVALALIPLLGIGGMGVPAAARDGVAATARVWVKMPFSGYWDRFGLSHPSEHPTRGDWAVDLYAAPGTAVRARIRGRPGTVVELRVDSVYPTCAWAGGKTVTLGVYADGARIGWVAYAHLDAVPAWVRSGEEVLPGSRLGALRMWRYERGCWEVVSEDGVHVHLAAADYSGYACYRSLQSGGFYVAGTAIGQLGRTSATATRQACD